MPLLLFHYTLKIPLENIFLGMYEKKNKETTVHKLSWQTKWHAKREGEQNSYFRLLLWSQSGPWELTSVALS